MLKKNIAYTDFNGNKRKEDFFFHLTKAELLELQMGKQGGLAETIQHIVDTQDSPELIKLFRDLVLRAYGEKSLDGKHFVKNQENKNAFSYTEAYSIIFMELATDSKAAAAFVNGIVPAGMAVDDATIDDAIAKAIGEAE